jgi:translation initiation factor 1
MYESSLPRRLPQKTQTRRFIAKAVGQCLRVRLPKQRSVPSFPRQPPRVPDDGVIRIMRERRRGGTMSVVTGLDERELAEVAKALKRHCGTGGTAKEGVVEIQGDHREKIAAWFSAQGRKAKVAGG